MLVSPPFRVSHVVNDGGDLDNAAPGTRETVRARAAACADAGVPYTIVDDSGEDAIVLALSTVTGRMLSSLLLEDEEVLTPETQFEIIRTTAPALVGRSLGEVDVRARLGCTVVAAERDGKLLTNLGAEFTIRAGDTLIVAGSDETVNRFISVAK
ncbi:hypothetical protein GCM10028856_07890 [Halopiger thermotolerans]